MMTKKIKFHLASGHDLKNLESGSTGRSDLDLRSERFFRDALNFAGMRSGNDDLQVRIGSAFLYLKFKIFFHENQKANILKSNTIL